MAVFGLTFVGSAFVALGAVWFLAVSAAQEDVRLMQSLRDFYTQSVDWRHPTNNEGGKALPVPTSFMLDFGRSLGIDEGRVELTSPYPFPGRTDRNLSAFDRQAWEYFQVDRNADQKALDWVAGELVLRFAKPDIMHQRVCVDCHNSTAASPRKDWRLGDVRGVFSKVTPLGDSVAVTLAACLCMALINASVVAAFIGSKRRIEAAKAASLQDPLTGLANRRAFGDQIVTMTSLHERRAFTGLSLILVDIDDFKRVNDTFGHPVGDQVIQWVGGVLSSAFRGTEAVSRIGGEEFAVLLQCNNREHARLIGDRVVKAVRSAEFRGEHDLDITISCGVAVRNLSEGTDSLFRRADAALYEAKKNGKDCAVLAA
ncbi:MAG: diguanylate cyclase [Alphaproteobacteria bacterium]|nr:diguanylate cyclase [Alphaproteobacteria bacterium]